MVRRWLGWGGGAGAILAIVATAIPAYRFEREKALARSEGIAVGAADVPHETVPDSENAASRIDRAVEAWRSDPASASLHTAYQDAAHRLIVGYAQPKDRASVRRWAAAHPADLALWRTAGERSRVDFGRRTEARWEATSKDVIDELYGARNLVAAAAADLDPKTNLIAAARLSNLLRREGNLYAVGKGARLGRECLIVACRKGFARDVLAEFGPPTDLRRTLQPELPRLLGRIERGKGEPRMRMSGVRGWLTSLQVSLAHPERQAVERWRRFWRALPKDGTDYDGAARIVDRDLPDVLRLAHPMDVVSRPSPLLGRSPYWIFTSTPGISGNLREIAAFEALRRRPL